MKNLIICGPSGSGKTTLVNWLGTLRAIYIEDNCSKDFIIKDKTTALTVYCTRDRVTYNDVDKRHFLILNLT